MSGHGSTSWERWVGALFFTLGLLSWSTPAHAACGDGILEEDEACDDGNAVGADGCSEGCRLECAEVGAAATDHTCLHGSSGPFVSVGSTPYPGPPLQAVSSPHTYYTIALPGSPGDNRAVVGFVPASTATYAMYLKLPYELRVLDGEGDEVPVLLEHAITSCAVADSLTWVRVYEELDETES